jgi:site-specific DNA-methyltransferase (adenine-specific)
MLEINKIYFEDCLVGMQGIDDKSIDMILCDLPYGTTACKWDVIIPFEPLWEQYRRIIKFGGAIVLTATQPFTTLLIYSNLNWFKYEWIWEKEGPKNPLVANKRVMPRHENILIFYNKQPIYNPQKIPRIKFRNNKPKNYSTETKGNAIIWQGNGNTPLMHPNSVIKISARPDRGLHPTQKPVDLFEYFIKTYSNENDLVLDNCMGSGTTAIACLNTNRNYIGFENDPKYFEIANQRILEHKEKLNAL